MNERLQTLEKSLRAVGRQGRRAFAVDGFDLFIDESFNAYNLSFAVPTASSNWELSIKGLIEVFDSYQRQARLEYFEECHPDLKMALEKAGFVKDMCAPVMALTKNHLVRLGSVEQGRYFPLTYKHEKELKEALKHQSRAFGGSDGASLIWFDSMIEGLRTESLMVSLLAYKGDFVSGASLQIGEGIGELAGVWTRPNMQQRGFAFELCQRLLEDYFRRYDLCWLSAAEGAQRLYTKLGFEHIGTQLNYGIHH